MALDPIGVIFTAKDLASGTVTKLDDKFKTLDDTTEETANNFSKNMKLMGAGLAAMAAGGVGLGILNAAGKKFAVLGTAIGEVSTLIEGTPEEMAQLEQATIGLSKTFGGSAVGQAQAFYQAISAGVGSVSDAQGFLEIANKVAIGGVTDATTAIDGLTTITNAFVDQNVKAGDAADAMFVAMKAGKTTIGELGSNISKAAPSAAALGVRFDELLGATSALTAGGVPTAEAFTQLKAVFTAFSTKQEIAKKLGVETANAFSLQNLKAKGLRGALMEVTGSVDGNIEKMAKLFGSSEAVNAVLSLTGSQSEKFAGIMEDMATRTGAADEAFLKMSNTTEFQEKKFDALSDALVLMVGKGFDPIRKVALQVGNAILSAFSAIPQPFIDFMVQAATWVASLLALGGAILFLKGAFAILSIIAAKVMLIIAPFVGAILAILGAITLLVIFIKTNFGGITDFFTDTWNTIKLFFTAILDVIRNGEISAELHGQLKEAGILGFVESVLRIFFKLKAFLSGIFEGFLIVWVSMVQPVFTAFVGSMRSVLSSIGKLFANVLGFIDSLMGGTTDLAGSMAMFQGAGIGIGAIFGYAFSIVADGILFVLTIVNYLIVGFTELLSTGVGVATALAEVFGGFAVFLSKVFASPKEAFMGMLDSIKQAFDIFISAFTDNKLVQFALSKMGIEIGQKEAAVPEAPIPGLGGEGFEEGGNILPFGLPKKEEGFDVGPLALSAQNKAVTRSAEGVASSVDQAGKKGGAPIVVQSTLMLDGEVAAQSINRANAKEQRAAGGQQ